MNAERWQRVKAIFHGAVESDSASRAQFLREHCGSDEELQREVESLLASAEDPGSLLENPVVGAGAMAAAAPANRTDPTVPISPGAVLPERYEILGELGRGGMGIVYKARDRETGEVMALKILKPEIAADLRIIERFKNELLLAHRITHHNVARLYEFHRAGDTLYLSMEYVEGESLRALLHRTGKLDVAHGLDIARQLAAGLADAHRQSIAHRDLKPENIMLTASGEVKVLDFGISRYYADNVTATGGFIGTPAYMAPEQAEGTPTDHRTDIYALVLILYEMFTGTKAFSGDSPVSLALKQLRESPQPPDMLAPDLPAHVEQAILKCLEKDPADRFQSVEELLHRLEGGAPDLDEVTHRSTVGLAARLGRRRMLIAAATLTIAAATAVYLYRHHPGILIEQDSIVLTDFSNTTGDPVFDNTLRRALSLKLEESPYLNVLPGPQMEQTLRLMAHDPREHVTPQLGREICVRNGLKAVVSGSIAQLGNSYILQLDATSANGEAIAHSGAEVTGKDRILLELGRAAIALRRKLGESIGSIQKFDKPLAEVTTSSLEALQAYTIAGKTSGAGTESIALLKRAIELDPNFALAYAALSARYSNLRQVDKAAEYGRKAFDLRDRVTEREKAILLEKYYGSVTGQLDERIQSDKLWTLAYQSEERRVG